MEKVIHIAKNHKNAAEWDLLQQVLMTVEERRRIAKELKIRFYGRSIPDVRERKK